MSWKRIIRKLKDIENLPTSNLKVVTAINLALLLRTIPWIILCTVTISYYTSIIRLIGIETYRWASLVALVFGGIGLVTSYFLRSYVKGFFEESAGRISKSIRLRAFNQELINRLCEDIRKKGENPKNYKLSLFNVDYDNIVIVKKPNFIREFYVAISASTLHKGNINCIPKTSKRKMD